MSRDDTVDRWSQSLIHALESDIPCDLLQETVESVVTCILHAGIHITEETRALSLSDLEGHGLTLLLEEQCSPLMTCSWAFLASTVIEVFLSPKTTPLIPSHALKKDNVCELCERIMPLTIHHLIPRSTHAYFLKHPSAVSDTVRPQVTKQSLLEHQSRICRPCHTQIHRLIPEHRELGTRYNTIEKLIEREDVMAWLHYARRQKTSDAKMGRTLRYRR